PDHGRFPGTVRPEEPEDRAARHGKADVIDGGEIAEALRQPFAFDHRVAHFTFGKKMSADMPARSASSLFSRRIFTPNTCLIRSSTVWTLRGVNSALRLIC